MYKTLKATYLKHTDGSEAQKQTYVCFLKQKSVLLAIEMRLTSLALMFLFFSELASTIISRRRMCLWNQAETV